MNRIARILAGGSTLTLIVALAGCLWAPILQNPPQTNYALVARSSDPRINDGKYDTIGSTPEDKPRIFVLSFPEPIQIHKIVIYNYNVFRFQLDAWDARTLRWKTFRSVRQRRDATGKERTAQPKFMFPRLNIVTDKLALRVSRTTDDKVVPKERVEPGDKVVNIESSPLYPLGYYYRVLIEAPARIREIQVFGSPVQ